MKRLFDEFFYIPKHGKIKDKVMLTHVVATITVVVLCLAAMSITAYAYFTYNITSKAGAIKATRFAAKIALQITDDGGKAVDLNPTTNDDQTHTVALEAWKPYTVVITPGEGSTAQTGYIIITAEGCKEAYHTQQLGVDEATENGKTSSITFELTLTDAAKVEFLAHWGTSSYYADYKENGDIEPLYITQNEEIKMIVNGVTEQQSNPPEKQPEPEPEEQVQPEPQEPSAPTVEETPPPSAEEDEAVEEEPSAEEETPPEEETPSEEEPPAEQPESQPTEEPEPIE